MARKFAVYNREVAHNWLRLLEYWSDLGLGFVKMGNEAGSKLGDSNSAVEDEKLDTDDNTELDETTVLNEPAVTDNVGDVSVEINVEELIANIESENDEDAARKKEIRRRLEEVAEEQSLEDTYAIDLGDDD